MVILWIRRCRLCLTAGKGLGPRRELAFHAQIDGRQINRYENDKVTPSVEVVVKLAKAFDVSVDHLLLEDAPRRPLLHEPAGKLAEKIMHLDNLSEEDEASAACGERH